MVSGLTEPRPLSVLLYVASFAYPCATPSSTLTIVSDRIVMLALTLILVSSLNAVTDGRVTFANVGKWRPHVKVVDRRLRRLDRIVNDHLLRIGQIDLHFHL